jgi:hypothetical protein
VDGQLDQILPEFRADGLANSRGIDLPEHAEGTRRSHDDQRPSFLVAERVIESARQRRQEFPLFLIVPVGLLDAAAGRAD